MRTTRETFLLTTGKYVINWTAVVRSSSSTLSFLLSKIRRPPNGSVGHRPSAAAVAVVVGCTSGLSAGPTTIVEHCSLFPATGRALSVRLRSCYRGISLIQMRNNINKNNYSIMVFWYAVVV